MKTRTKSKSNQGGRINALHVEQPEAIGPLRNYHHNKTVDDFLNDQKTLGRRRTSVIDVAVAHFKNLPPSEQDRIWRELAPTLTR